MKNDILEMNMSLLSKDKNISQQIVLSIQGPFSVSCSEWVQTLLSQSQARLIK